MDEELFEAAVDGGGLEPSPTEALKSSLAEATKLQDLIGTLEEDLAAFKRQFHKLRTAVIPEQMAELGMSELAFDGWRVKVEEIVSGSLPKDPEKKAAAIRWLEEHDAGGLIKTELSLSFGRSEHDTATEVAKELEGKGFAPTVGSSVHAQTLMAFGRQRLKDGEPIDFETLGLYSTQIAKFKKEKD